MLSAKNARNIDAVNDGQTDRGFIQPDSIAYPQW